MPLTPFNWEEYIAIANTLVATHNEAHDRCIMSRAYYAAYNFALDHLTPQERIDFDNDLADPAKKGGSHALLWIRYDRVKGSGPDTIGRDGRRLREWRVSADYRAYDHISPRNAELSIVIAMRIIGDIKRLRP